MKDVSRRQFLKTLSAIGPTWLVGTSLSVRNIFGNVRGSGMFARPTQAQLEWQDAEVGVIFHFDLPIAGQAYAPNNTVKERLDPNLYQPRRLNTDQWLEAARIAGARYAVFTATHFNGFLQWQSDLYPYGVKQSSWRNGKGNVVADFITSCHKYNIKPALYFSTHRNAYWTVWGHYVNWGKGRGTQQQEKFNRVAEKMTEELCSRYGRLLEIWYDAGVKTPNEGGPDVLPVVEDHQPDIVFYHNKQRADHRWIGNEEGYAGYPCWAAMPYDEHQLSHASELWRPHLLHGLADGSVWSPGMVDVPLRGANGVHNWFWHPDQVHGLHSTETLVQMYYDSVGRNCNFIIGAVINPDGLVPEPDVLRLREFGDEIRRRFSVPVAHTGGMGSKITLELAQPQSINHVLIREDITKGERVREYHIEGYARDSGWQRLGEGTSIGHKRIQQFSSVETTKIRLRILKSSAKPHIRQLSVFNIE